MRILALVVVVCMACGGGGEDSVVGTWELQSANCSGTTNTWSGVNVTLEIGEAAATAVWCFDDSGCRACVDVDINGNELDSSLALPVCNPAPSCTVEFDVVYSTGATASTLECDEHVWPGQATYALANGGLDVTLGTCVFHYER